MVYLRAEPLDRTFAALADPTRRALLARLSEQDSVTVSELARPFPISLPAVTKHLDVSQLKCDGEGTLLTLTHERFFDEAARDRHQAGWAPILDRPGQELPAL
jgi:DNA-binding transcriptional ArsR family regulator